MDRPLKTAVDGASQQGCGLGLDVSVSRRRDGLETYQRLETVSRKIVNVSVSGSRRLGLGNLRLVPKANYRPNCAFHINKMLGYHRETALQGAL